MQLITSNNIYINLGDDQYRLIKNEYIYEFKKYYFKNDIKIKYANNIYDINLKNEKYFQIKIINIGNFILLYVFNKEHLFFNSIIYINNNYIDNNIDNYIDNYNKFLVYQLRQLIYLLKSKLGSEIKLPRNLIFKIINKLNIIEDEINELGVQKILYYKEYIKTTFSL